MRAFSSARCSHIMFARHGYPPTAFHLSQTLTDAPTTADTRLMSILTMVHTVFFLETSGKGWCT